MSALESANESALSAADPTDLIHRRFPIQWLEAFQRNQRVCLITLREKKQSDLELIANQGARLFDITPTAKLLQLQTKEKSSLAPWTTNYVPVRIGTIHVTEVLKEDEYKMPGASPGDEFRFVLGRLRDTPTPEAKVLGTNYCTIQAQELKFRAVLQYNQFAKTYTFVTSDIGKPEDATWQSRNVK